MESNQCLNQLTKQSFNEPFKASEFDLRSPAVGFFRRGLLLGWLRVLSLIALDIGAIFSAWWLAVIFGRPTGIFWNVSNSNSVLFLILAVNISIFAARGLYKAGWYRRDCLGIIKAVSLAEALVLLIAFLQSPEQIISRFALFLSWGGSIAFVLSCRFVFDILVNLFRNQGVARYPIFVISSEENLDKYIKAIESEGCYRLLGFADSSALDRVKRDTTFATLSSLGITEAFVSWDSIKNRLHLCWYFQRRGITLRILFSEAGQNFSKPDLTLVGGIPAISLNVPTLIGSDYWIKKSFDFICALLLLILFSPVYLLIAILIKLDSPGGIFFRQTRIGLNGQSFKVWKFRTMVSNADQLQATLEASNEMEDGVLFKMKDDPRITKIGKFLRAYSLDELPQLINVLVGEMSFVGPRPLPVRDVEKFKEQYFIRQEVLPGITGLWQVSGRSDIDNFEDAVNLDLAYINNWSLWLDLKIMLRTVGVVLKKSGAY